MNAPLSRYLTRFAGDVAGAVSPPPIAPTVVLTVADLDGRLEDARAGARAEAEAVHLVLRAELELAHASAVTEAVAAARTEWCDGAAAEIAGIIERGFAALRADIAEATAKVLRPMLTGVTRERALAALEATVARLLADPAHPAVTLCAPADLVAVLRARGMSDGVALVAGATAEAVVSCGGTRIETRLAAALADIAGV